ncbi:hypothetical protein DSO57_1034698, partial [Entomophthora muscae]
MQIMVVKNNQDRDQTWDPKNELNVSVKPQYQLTLPIYLDVIHLVSTPAPGPKVLQVDTSHENVTHCSKDDWLQHQQILHSSQATKPH